MALFPEEIPLEPGLLEPLPEDFLPEPEPNQDLALAWAELSREWGGEAEALGPTLEALESERVREQAELRAEERELDQALAEVVEAGAGPEEGTITELLAEVESGDQAIREVEDLLPSEAPPAAAQTVPPPAASALPPVSRESIETVPERHSLGEAEKARERAGRRE